MRAFVTHVAGCDGWRRYLSWSHVHEDEQSSTWLSSSDGAVSQRYCSSSWRSSEDFEEPVTLTFGLLSPWAQAAGSGCLLLRYLCSQWTQKKDEMGTSWPAVLLAHIVLWALTHNCKGLWKIGTFYCFCSNHHFICLPFSPSCPYSSLYSSFSFCLPSILHSLSSLSLPLFPSSVSLSPLILTVIPRFPS